MADGDEPLARGGGTARPKGRGTSDPDVGDPPALQGGPLARGGSPTDFEQLLATLYLTRSDDWTYIGSHPSKTPLRTFGGQLMAQALVAASRTVRHDIPPSAMHVHFISAGNPLADIEYRVASLRDQRRIANRRVDAVQDGQVLATALVAYMSGGHGLEHGAQPPDVPDPNTLPPIGDLLRGYEKTVPLFVEALRPIEWRYANDPAWVMRQKGDRLHYNRVWMKADGAMPDDPTLHTAAMVYSSDTTVLDSIITTHGLSWGFDRIFAASVNHSMWFHRQVNFGDWVLYSTESPVAADSRGLGKGHFFDRAGSLVATVVQEGVLKYFPGRDAKRA